VGIGGCRDRKPRSAVIGAAALDWPSR
jgi:hypothetical protein